MVRGKDRLETRQLTEKFAQLNPELVGFQYPKRETSGMPLEVAAVALQ
jgi:hypothetical protein